MKEILVGSFCMLFVGLCSFLGGWCAICFFWEGIEDDMEKKCLALVMKMWNEREKKNGREESV